MRVAGLVLAAGASSRFGSPKALARLDGKPILEHVLDAVREAGIEDLVVVLGHAAEEIEDGIEWLDERRVINRDPRELSGSLRVGLSTVEDLDPPAQAAVVVLGDQPKVRPEVIRTLIAAARSGDRPVVTPRYSEGGGPNPVLLRREAFDLADEAEGDQGLGPILAARPELVAEVPVVGRNPDVDTPADLAELAWADRVQANRDQVDRVREVPDGEDFYAPVLSLFRADPRRTDDPVLDALRELVVPGETWLDIGAGAGRYALPLALEAGEVIAVDPSAGMLASLGELMAEHGIPNIRPIPGRWPPDADLAAALGPLPAADVALIAHVGYDIESIGPFLTAMEAAVRRLCVAVLTQRPPASVADPCWPPVHGEARVSLPALPELVDLLRARGREPEVTMLVREPRTFETKAELDGFLRRQLWIADGGEKERRFRAALDEIVLQADGRFGLADQRPLPIGVVTWSPSGAGLPVRGSDFRGNRVQESGVSGP